MLDDACFASSRFADNQFAEEVLSCAGSDLDAPRGALRCRIVQAAGRARERRTTRQYVLRGVSVGAVFCAIFFAAGVGQELPERMVLQTPVSAAAASQKTAYFDLRSRPGDSAVETIGEGWEGMDKASQWRVMRARALRNSL